MAIYQASKQLVKFGISGLIAVAVDFIVYYALSQFLGINLSKGLSFCSGMLVTYNLNKYWTWRQTDKNNKRLALFTALYLIAMVVNIVANHYALQLLPDSTFFANLQYSTGELIELAALKIDKVLAFIIATAVSASFTFLGQKYWLFKVKD
jgi:putative flippase GtrA